MSFILRTEDDKLTHYHVYFAEHVVMYIFYFS